METKTIKKNMTYIVVCDKTYTGYFKIKIGKTNNWHRRYRVYKLHNQNIKDVLVFDGDFEQQLLFDYREYRIFNDETNYNTEWIELDYSPINEIIENYKVKKPFYLYTTAYSHEQNHTKNEIS